MKEFHHIGIPSDKTRAGEIYLEGAKLHVTPVDASPNKIEWLRFEADSPMPSELKTTAHVAYQVDNLEKALEGQKVLIEPFLAMEGVRVAFICEDGVPVELMQLG
ncbi:MAG TPA: hypothetical protein PLA90_05685 [Candidatus Sumerlaeota bacterium]|nr:hypothetical protein [Candidatus Sumerlaeota bacterium]HPS01015.1 hypothetical protein [Candidatus Sumerlaeota bacterium]